MTRLRMAFNMKPGWPCLGGNAGRVLAGALPDAEVECFEEHLLVCPQCQDNLAEMDVFVDATRRAARRLREEQAVLAAKQGGVWSWFPHPAWLAAAAGLAILLVGGRICGGRDAGANRHSRCIFVRSAAAICPLVRRVPAARPLRVHLDLAGLAGPEVLPGGNRRLERRSGV